MKRLLRSGRFAILGSCTVLALISEPRDVGAQAETPAVASAPSDTGRAREQFRVLAPYLSMGDLLRLEELDVAAVAAALKRVNEYQSRVFDAHPILAELGPKVVRFLIAGEARIMPVLRAKIDLRDPEGALGALFVELASRYMEDQVLREWQREYDRFCQAGFSDLLPLARALAGPIDSENNPVRIGVRGQGAGARLVAENTGGRAMSNVSLAVRFESISGDRLDHYYFVEAWPAGGEVPLRVAVDWWSVGAARTTGATIEVIADQLRTQPARMVFHENIQAAVRETLVWARHVAPGEPGEALRQIAAARKAAGNRALIAECDEAKRGIRVGLVKKEEALEKQLAAARAEEKRAKGLPEALRSSALLRARQMVKVIEGQLRVVRQALAAK